MRARTRAAAAVLVTAVLTAGCATAATAAGPPPPTPARGPLGVESACDQFGHRVYGYQGGYGKSIAVVPNDRSCPQPSPRARDL